MASGQVVRVSTVATGCLDRRFDETYSLLLQGHIDQQEWAKEIAEVNGIFGPIFARQRRMVFLPLAFFLFMPVMIIVAIYTGIFYVIFVGFALFFFAALATVFINISLMKELTRRVHEFLATKNQQLWLPRGIQWRLLSEVHGRRKHRTVVYWIEIELAAHLHQPVVIMMPNAAPPMYPTATSSPPVYPMATTTAPPMYPTTTAPMYPTAPTSFPPTYEPGPSAFCGKCGSPSVVGDTFCRKCGNAV